MKKHILMLLLIPGILVILTGSCNKGAKNVTEEKEEEVLPEDIVEMREDQVRLAGIETGTFEMRTLNNTLKVNGIVSAAPQNLASVCAPLGGFIRTTSLLPGYAVSKGQVLAVVENQEFIDIQQSFLEARNELVFSEAEYKRHSELFKNDVYSEKNVQQVTTDYKILKARVNALEQKLALIGIDPAALKEDNISRTAEIHSPISGFVTSVNVNIGKFVAPTDVLFQIVNTSNLLLELTLFDKDADDVAKGQKIRFFINNETDTHEAEVYQTGKSIDSDKTFKVFAKVTSACENVIPGMYVNAIIETSGNQVAALPENAIVTFDDKDYIFVFDRNKEEDGKPFTEYRMIEVHRGISDNGFTEVIFPDGFDIKSAKVVVKGAYNLLSAKKNAGEMAC